MKKIIVMACLATTVSMTAGTAMADSIRGKLGVTGRIGILTPADNNAEFHDNKTDVGLIGGGGIIYGVSDNVAVEIDLTRSTFGSDTGDFGITNISLGGQYRFAIQPHQLVPYVGAGLDILISDYDENGGARSDVDSTVGVHVSGGVDYFIQKNLAVTAEAKLVGAHDVKITDRSSGVHAGDFDPSSFSTTVGIRYFFN